MQSFPIIAIIGRPNVGKSTLFNVLTKGYTTLVADIPGVTRDRIYGEAVFVNQHFTVVDTGGIVDGDSQSVDQKVTEQAWLAVFEADIILLVVDAKAGVQPDDQQLAKQLRLAKKKTDKIILVANKMDGLTRETALAEFYQLGFKQSMAISSKQNQGICDLWQLIATDLQASDIPLTVKSDSESIHISIIGRPNVGKSTLINRILKENRVITHNEAGTTRDSVFIPFDKGNNHYMLIDTAGVRRKSRINLKLEHMSIIKSIRAIGQSHVVILLVDGHEQLVEQDLKLLGLALQSRRVLMVVVNKWDGLTHYERQQFIHHLQRRLNFASWVRCYFISALHGSGIKQLLPFATTCYQKINQSWSTSSLTSLLNKALLAHRPPMVGGKRIKLRYAHMGGNCPLTLIIHGKQIKKLPISYKRYLENYFRSKLKLDYIPIRLYFKQDDNPFVKPK